MKEIALFVLVVAIIVIVPFAGIWAVNTLFGTGIAYTFKTWAATAILTSIISPSVTVKKN